MAIAPQGLLVPGPVIQPSKYGLLSIAQEGTETTDPHWQAGITWDDALCADVHVTLPNCGLESTPQDKELDGGATFRSADPFTVYASYFCSTGGRPADYAFGIARNRLLVNEHKGVENAFWTGTTPDGTLVSSLAYGDVAAGITPTDLSPGGALDPVAAIAVLESAIADCSPGLGAIHMNYGLAAYLANLFLLVRVGDHFETPTGQQVALGAGYPGTGPAGAAAAPGETWIFGTGPVKAWKGEVFLTPENLSEGIDRTLNNVTVFAERTWAVGFSCCLFAVRAALTCGCEGGILTS